MGITHLGHQLQEAPLPLMRSKQRYTYQQQPLTHQQPHTLQPMRYPVQAIRLAALLLHGLRLTQAAQPCLPHQAQVFRGQA